MQPLEYHPFEPIIFDDSRILILGTFPSFKSIENSFYYGHPQNQFWKLLSAVFGEEEPRNIDEKIALFKRHKIALWDMVRGCMRQNSLDSSLKNIEVNDIEGLLKRHPSIELVCFTSKTAQKLYQRHFAHLPIKTAYLPSPSPAYRAIGFDEKLKRWKEVLGSR